MKNRKTIVLTLYGCKDRIEEVLVNLFEDNDSGNSLYHRDIPANAHNYCDFVNSLKLKDDKWVFARIVKEDERIFLEAAAPQTFEFLIPALDDLAVEKVIRKTDERVLAAALTETPNAVREKMFRNMSKNQADTIRDAIEAGTVSPYQIDAAQRKILDLIRRMIDSGAISCAAEGEAGDE
jgi:flagellar motor switch protein FliG